MRRSERAGYPDIHRFLQTVGEDVSLRWVIRHFGRGHDRFSPPSDDTEIPTWLFEDEEDFERYMHQYGYCRTIDDLCPHISPRTVSTCERIDHPECGTWRQNVLRERVIDLEAARPAGLGAAGDAGGGRVALVEPLSVNQPLEIEIGGPHAGIYASAVMAVDATQLSIRTPTRLKETLSVAPGERMTVFYRGRVSKYGFDTTVRAVRPETVAVDPPITVTIASRRSPRISLRDARADVSRTEQGDVQVTGRGIDASIRGLRVVLPAELPQWERVRVTLHLPDGALAINGEIVRVEPGSAPREFVHGIYFTGLSPEEVARLRKLGN